MSSEISPHIILPEAKLAFHSERPADIDIHPLRGLLRFGAYSKGLVPGPIRVATIAPFKEGQPLYDFMKELNQSFGVTERKDYLQAWPGFGNVFGTKMTGAARDCHLQLPKTLEAELEKSVTPHIALTEALTRALQLLEARRNEFDVVFIYIPARWKRGFEGGPDEDFDLHDHLKAITAIKRIPIQLVREDKALAYQHRASVMWRIGLALYTKAGGIPWKLATTDPDTAYIGISYALRPLEVDRRFVTCCSQVFDAEGSGLEFIGYDTREVEVQRENPFLSRIQMFRVMARSLDLYQRRHAGQSPRRIVVHKSTEFTTEEVEGCLDALSVCESVDLVQVVSDVGWRGARIESKGKPADYPVARGTLLPLSPKEALLWMHGSVDGIHRHHPYFQGSRSTPRPIRLVRHAGHGPWDDTAASVLALSKMNWNNDALYDTLPVTMSYAQVLAGVVKRMDGLGTTPYQFRFFM